MVVFGPAAFVAYPYCHHLVDLDYHPGFPVAFVICSFVDCPAACPQGSADYWFAVAGCRPAVAVLVVAFVLVPAPVLFVSVVESGVSFLPSPMSAN